MHKNRHRMPPHHLSHPPSRGRKKEGTMQVLLEGYFTRSLCEYPPECQFYKKTESGCKAGDKCQFPHHKVDEQPKKKAHKERPFTKKKRKRRQKCSGYCENRISVWLCPRKIQMHSFLKVESLGETPCKESWDRFDKYDSLSLRYVKQVSGKRKDHRLEKYKSKFLISDAPEVRRGILPRTYTSSKKRTTLNSTRPRKNEHSRLRQQKSRRKDSLWWIL